MLVKNNSLLELWRPFCLAEQIHLSNFGSEHHEDQFCEIILNLDQWFRSCCLKNFLSRALAALMLSGGEHFMQFCKGEY